MISMDENTKSSKDSLSNNSAIIDVSEKVKSISIAKDAHKVPENSANQIETLTIQKTIKYCLLSMLSVSTKPALMFSLITSVAMMIGILVLCLTQPTPSNPKCLPTLKRMVQLSSSTSSNPQSVAVGDLNNDTWIDIIVADTGNDIVGVFLSYGNNTFAKQVIYSTGIGSSPRMIVVYDFNNDNQLDIAVANFGTNNVGILFGNGDGSFKNQTNIEISPSHPLYLAVGDLNNDKQIDIVITNHGTSSIGVLFGSGDGGFTKYITLSTGYDSLPSAVAVGDFNNDNKLDIVSANFGTGNIGVFLGYGNATFAFQTTITTGINSHPYSITVADVNNDTKLDIAVVDSMKNYIVIFLGSGNGTFNFPIFLSTGSNSNPIFIVIADFNKDNKPDVVIANNGTNSVGVLFGYGNGFFANQSIYPTDLQSSPYSIAVADFNNDNQLDIAVVNEQNNNVMIFNGYRNQTFSSQITYQSGISYYPVGIILHDTGSGSQPYSVAVGDFNSDGRLDISVANSGTDNVGVLLGYGDGTFADQTTYSTGDYSGPSAVAVGDFNSDGRLDIVVANFGTNNVGVLLGYGDGTFADQTTYTTGDYSGPSAVAVGDFNSDGRLDITIANSGTNNVGVLLGYGDGTFAVQNTYSTDTGSGPIGIAVGDFNNDKRLDIAVTNYRANNIGVLLGRSNGTFASQLKYSTGISSGPGSLFVGDFNNDSQLDIAVANYGTNNVGVLLGFADGTFAEQNTYSTGNGSFSYCITVGDFNNDSRLDIAVVNAGTNNVGVLLGYGYGNFSSQMIYTTGDRSYPVSLTIGDFNNDSKQDIVVANYGTNNVGFLLGCGNGTFPLTTYIPGIDSYPTWVSIGDFNNDDRLDIAVAYSGTNNIGVLLGYGNGTLANPMKYTTGIGSQPIAIALGDFNNDGRLDIAVTNSGTNNVGVLLGYGNGTFEDQKPFSTGISSNPKAIAIGDFNNDGRLDITIVNHGTNNAGVLLGYGDGTFADQTIYSIGGNSGPNVVAIGDFNNDGQPDIAVAMYLADSVGIFLGYGNGTFTSEIICYTGAYSRPLVLAVGDFDSDHNLDIAVLNVLSEEEHVLILLGSGNGTFSSDGRYQTGINSDPSSIVVGHFNNDSQLDIAVTNRGTDTVGIFFGGGDGKFSSQNVYAAGDGFDAISIAVGDFNGDNLTDAVVANNRAFTVGVLLAFFNTSFEYTATYPTGSAAGPDAITVGGFTNDGKLDVVIGNQGTHDISLLLRYENDSFSMEIAYSADFAFYPVSMVVADFNNDSRLDVAVANSLGDQVCLVFGEGNGTFVNYTAYSTPIDSNPQSISMGDFNKDNRTDIVVSNSGTGSVGLLLRADSGAFGSLTTLSTGLNSKPDSVAVGDFDNDGLLDIVVALNGQASVGVFYGFGNGTFSKQNNYSLDNGFYPVWICVGDFNNDRRLDILTIDNIGRRITVLLGSGNDFFEKKTTYTSSYLGEAAVGNFNNDSRLDVTICQIGDNTIIVLLGNGDGTFSNQITYSTGANSGPNAITLGDFNNDGQLDIAVANYITNNVGVLLGYGNGTFSSQMTYPTGAGSSPCSVAIGDFNNDGQRDITVSNQGTNNVGVLLGYGNGTFSSQMTYPTGAGSFPRSVTVSDFNQDHRMDIVVANQGTNNVCVLLGHANGTFFNKITYSSGDNSNPMSVAVGDFNRDGRLDITVCNRLAENIGVFLGYASDSLLSTPDYSIGNSSVPVSIATGDFNNDTNLDAVVADKGTNEVVILYGSGYGTFTHHDHQLDIAVANAGTNNIGVFLGNPNGNFSIPTMYSTGNFSSPRSLAVGYFDNDTLLDIAVANYGTNKIAVFLGYSNGSFANPLFFPSGFGSHPSALVFGNLNKNNWTDIYISNSGYSTIDVLSKTC
ncbi:unnamed protein product [Rotaria socialis]|uniref:Uncharacterized protein n=2 Tax=Rotaria socialis TaxID=392032 RepID=A0A820ILH5_9BILA|nr:unnamed protein product [Rotaria socialis]